MKQRTIKFRVWDKKMKVMVAPNAVADNGAITVDNGLSWEHGLIIMQFTGLKDKNGKGRWSKEIYEGDIVEDKNGERYQIIYQEEWGAFVADQGDGGLIAFLAKDKKWADNDKLLATEIKVIGNVFQDNDLLK